MDAQLKWRLWQTVAMVACCCVLVACSEDVRRPPAIVSGPSGQQVTKMGGASVVIPCEATGSPQPSEYQWFKNGAKLDLNNQNIYRPDHTQGTIKILQPSSFDEGFYQCTAKNVWGTARSDVEQVIMATLGGYPAPAVKTITVEESSFQMLVCDPTKVTPNATYLWGVTSSTTDPNVVALTLSDRINVDNKGNLYFSHVEQSDWRKGQIYKCQVKNPWMDQMVGGSYVTLSVTPKSVSAVKPMLRYTTSTLVGLKGRDVSMRCIFSGKESPRITWERVDGNGVLPVGRLEISMYDTNMRIKDLTLDDKGSYRCTGTNSAGSAQQMIYLDIKVVPEFESETDGPRNMNVTEGDDVTVNCRTNADPTATVNWYINGDIFTANNRRRVSADGLSLTLMGMCRSCLDGSSDLMVVSCNASNSYGYAYRSGYINVLKKTQISEAPFPATMMYPYDVNITCSGTSDPSTPVTVEWYDSRGNMLYNQTNHYEITQLPVSDVSQLRIIVSNDKDGGASKTGQYTCVVSNRVSEDSRSVIVSLAKEPETVVASASILDNWWIFVAIFCVVLLLFIIILVCFVCVRRNKGDVYRVDESEVKNGNNPKQELLDTGYKGYVRQDYDGPLRSSRATLGSHLSMNSDVGSLAEYEADYGKFNEEGSFLGAYRGDQKTPGYATNV